VNRTRESSVQVRHFTTRLRALIPRNLYWFLNVNIRYAKFNDHYSNLLIKVFLILGGDPTAGSPTVTL
jgi:hypothetical protein